MEETKRQWLLCHQMAVYPWKLFCCQTFVTSEFQWCIKHATFGCFWLASFNDKLKSISDWLALLLPVHTPPHCTFTYQDSHSSVQCFWLHTMPAKIPTRTIAFEGSCTIHYTKASLPELQQICLFKYTWMVTAKLPLRVKCCQQQNSLFQIKMQKSTECLP